MLIIRTLSLRACKRREGNNFIGFTKKGAQRIRRKKKQFIDCLTIQNFSFGKVTVGFRPLFYKLFLFLRLHLAVCFLGFLSRIIFIVHLASYPTQFGWVILCFFTPKAVVWKSYNTQLFRCALPPYPTRSAGRVILFFHP